MGNRVDWIFLLLKLSHVNQRDDSLCAKIALEFGLLLFSVTLSVAVWTLGKLEVGKFKKI